MTASWSILRPQHGVAWPGKGQGLWSCILTSVNKLTGVVVVHLEDDLPCGRPMGGLIPPMGRGGTPPGMADTAGTADTIG